MNYNKCRSCPYICDCCANKGDHHACGECYVKTHHEFEPKAHIAFCPLNGDSLNDDILTLANHHSDLVGKWIAYKVKGNDAVMHGQVVDFPPRWYIQVKKKHNRTNMVELANVIKVFDSKEECYAYK